ncbi:MAG: gliding motility-associated C-terminal domain-containing protein, partial [Actinomycetota bacterium]|nr:gliding motility-associated C-terminal domain-containing protein [Actinomycetota bacterium]
AQLGLPKLYEPRVESGEGLVRFRARLSSRQPWVVTVTDAGKLEAARGAGTGTTVDWTWDSTLVPAGRYTWTMRSGSARPATGPLRIGGTTPALAIQEITATPETITPNGDGQGDVAALAYRLTVPANVTVEVVDEGGFVVSTVVDRVWTRAGEHAVDIDGAALTDGAYSILVRARTRAGLEVEKVVPLLVSRTLGLVSVTPSLFSPNEDGRSDLLEIAFSLTAAADVSIRVVRDGRWVASPHAASYEAGSHTFQWNGIRSAGRLRDGSYSAVIDATDTLLGRVSVVVPFVSDTAAPRVRLLPTRGIRVELSEPAVLYLTIDGARRERHVKRAGTVRIRWEGAARRVRVVARDGAGNTSAPVVRVREASPPGE